MGLPAFPNFAPHAHCEEALHLPRAQRFQQHSFDSEKKSNDAAASNAHAPYPSHLIQEALERRTSARTNASDKTTDASNIWTGTRPLLMEPGITDEIPERAAKRGLKYRPS